MLPRRLQSLHWAQVLPRSSNGVPAVSPPDCDMFIPVSLIKAHHTQNALAAAHPRLKSTYSELQLPGGLSNGTITSSSILPCPPPQSMSQ